MIRFRALGTEFRLHILTLLAGALAVKLGLGRELPYLMLAMGAHELAHLAAAKICGMEIEYIDIMCFGGTARIRNLYGQGRIKLIIVALAGPMANMILALAGAALAWWGVIGIYAASVIVRTDLLLMLFNLMPALPLDGGRVLYALASIWLSRGHALRLGVAFAQALAAGLAVIALYGWFVKGIFNLTLMLMAVFLVAGSLKEMESARQGTAGRTLAALCGEYELPGKAQVIAFPWGAPPEEAAAHISRDRVTLFAMVEKGSVREIVTGDEMARRMMGVDGQTADMHI